MPYEKSQILEKLTQKLKKLLKNYKILEDIIIFGSLIREKSNPKDIDIALLVNQKNEFEIDRIKEEINKIIPDLNIDASAVISIKELYHPIWISIIKEGFSISKGKFFSDIYGIKATKLYKYSIKKLTPVQKVQFDRGLGVLIKKLEGIKLVRTIALIPLEKSEQFEEFLKTWGIEFETQRYNLLSDYQKHEKLIFS